MSDADVNNPRRESRWSDAQDGDRPGNGQPAASPQQPGAPATHFESLQDHIIAVQQARGTSPRSDYGDSNSRSNPAPASPRRPMRMAKVVVAGVVIAGAIALWQYARLGFGVGGGGMVHVLDSNGTSPRTTPPPPVPTQPTTAPVPAAPQRPLRVTIRGESYFVDGKPTSLEEIVKQAQDVPPGDGPAVMVTRESSSKVNAENSLRSALENKHLSNTGLPALE